MEKNVCIVNFNTTELTRAAILSLWKNTPDCKVTVWDNSDREPFPQMDGVRIIDNTKGQIIDFDKFLDEYPDKQHTTANNWGSAKHTKTIDVLFDYFPDGFVLMDSDVLVKKDISVFFDETKGYIGKVFVDRNSKYYCVPRLLPFLCWINVKMCRRHDIRYFDGTRSWKLDANTSKYHLYDTGASFLEDCVYNELPFKIIDITEYIIHLGSGSWKGQKPYKLWLETNKHLYMTKEDKAEKYLVVIPYFAGGAQGRELEYSIAGWRRHFKENFLIVIVGDHHPVCDTGDDIMHIPCERVPEQPFKNYRPHIDFVKKFKAVRKEFPKSDGFIFVADDVYAVNDFDIWDVKCLKANGTNLEDGTLGSASPWIREKAKTRELLKKEGYPTRNFTTHLPTWIEWGKLEKLWEKYYMENNSYIFEDLYFNIYYPTRVPIMLHIDHDNFKCGVYRPNPRLNYIDNAFKSKIWIQNSVEGWIPYLDKKLSEYYGI